MDRAPPLMMRCDVWAMAGRKSCCCCFLRGREKGGSRKGEPKGVDNVRVRGLGWGEECWDERRTGREREWGDGAGTAGVAAGY